MSLGELSSDRTWSFDVGVERVWSNLAQTGRFGTWWPWLREFDAPDGLVAGAEWKCVVRPPLPYTLRFTVVIDEVERPRHVAARVRGDLLGQARLDLTPDGDDRCTLRLRSTLRPAHRPLAVLGLFAGPVLRWGHDWVLNTGLRQFSSDLSVRS